MIKNWWEYKEGNMCGEVFRRIWITKDLQLPSSDVALMGQYFEYLCTGALLRDGTQPQPVLTKSGSPVAKQQYLIDQVTLWKKAVVHYGIANIETGRVIEVDAGEYIIVVRPDVVCEMPRIGKCIIDIKTTGLLNDKGYNDYSWNREYIGRKPKLTIQAKLTKLACQDAMKIENIPFYWFVFSNTGDGDALFCEAIIDKNQVAKTVDLLEETVSLIEIEKELGFTFHPEYKRCKDCPLNNSCTQKNEVPLIERIHTT
jgi:hypothetical protein